jgi:hypothetical protein
VRGEGRIKDERIKALEGQLMVANKLVENERLEGAIRQETIPRVPLQRHAPVHTRFCADLFDMVDDDQSLG